MSDYLDSSLAPSPAPSADADNRDHLDEVQHAVDQAVAASDLIAACEAGWAAIQARHPEVPDTVVVLGTGVERGRLVKLGHWWGEQWRVGGEARGEVLLAGEALHLPPEAVFEVLLHEAAHGLAAARGIRDTSRTGRYHNALYKAVAAEVGLRPRRMDPHGWARTLLTPAAAETYAGEIAGIRAEMRLTRGLPARRSIEAEGGVEGIGGGTTGTGDADQNGGTKTKQRAAECGCEPGRKLRMAPSVLEQGPVICGLCGSDFALPHQAEATLVSSAKAGEAQRAGEVGTHPTAGIDLRTIELPSSESAGSQATLTTTDALDPSQAPGGPEPIYLPEAAVPTAEAAP
ncbi:MAG TPA: hypothetical protein VM142_11015 [Acidimicrobiales bacterium]|nr:hypothetical protein [Acidimicrobiales bacterium]